VMLKSKEVCRMVMACNSCDRDSEPTDVIGGRSIINMEEAFAKIMWLVNHDGAWCPDCKGLPR
jgi:hypothetical protein